MDASDLNALLETIAAASSTLDAQPLAGPDQAELAAIISAAVANLRASGHLVHIPAGDDHAALNTWLHAVIGQIALFITAADLLASDTDRPLPGPARACAHQIYAAAAQMRAIVNTCIAAQGDGP